MKHVIGQAIYMVSVILVILFVGEYFIPEENEVIDGVPLSFDGKIRPGRGSDYDGTTDKPYLYTEDVERALGPSRHFTILFTTFVFLQIVNEWNCRKLHDEVNIFSGIFKNRIALGIRAFEIVMQVIISQFGSFLFDLYPGGLTWYQWLICIGFSLGSFLVRLILLCVPDNLFVRVCFSSSYTLVRQREGGSVEKTGFSFVFAKNCFIPAQSLGSFESAQFQTYTKAQNDDLINFV